MWQKQVIDVVRPIPLHAAEYTLLLCVAVGFILGQPLYEWATHGHITYATPNAMLLRTITCMAVLYLACRWPQFSRIGKRGLRHPLHDDTVISFDAIVKRIGR